MAKLLKMLWEYMDLTVLPFFETWSAHIFGGWQRVCWCTNEAFNQASPTKEFWENCPQKKGGHIYGKNEGWAYLRKLLYSGSAHLQWTPKYGTAKNYSTSLSLISYQQILLLHQQCPVPLFNVSVFLNLMCMRTRNILEYIFPWKWVFMSIEDVYSVRLLCLGDRCNQAWLPAFIRQMSQHPVQLTSPIFIIF